MELFWGNAKCFPSLIVIDHFPRTSGKLGSFFTGRCQSAKIFPRPADCRQKIVCPSREHGSGTRLSRWKKVSFSSFVPIPLLYGSAGFRVFPEKLWIFSAETTPRLSVEILGVIISGVAILVGKTIVLGSRFIFGSAANKLRSTFVDIPDFWRSWNNQI